MNALILAAGLGTRLRPLTDNMPKALVKVAGRTLLETQITKLRAAGTTEIVVNVHHLGRQIIDYVAARDWGVPVSISDERDRLLDTGGGLRKAWPLFRDAAAPVLVHNVDILGNAKLSTLYAGMETEHRCAARLLVSQRETTRYLLFDDAMQLVGWTNTQTGEVRSPVEGLRPESSRRYAFSGIHVVGPLLRPLLDAGPEKFSIIDFYLSVCRDYCISGFVQDDLHLLDVGKTTALAEATQFIEPETAPI